MGPHSSASSPGGPPSLPVELLSHIFSFIHPCTTFSPAAEHLQSRNTTLCSLSLVSCLWHNAAQQELLSDLRVRWDARSGAALARLFRNEPRLRRIVRSVTAVRPKQALHGGWSGPGRRVGGPASSTAFWEWAATLPGVHSFEANNFPGGEVMSVAVEAFLGRLSHLRLDGPVRPLLSFTPHLRSLTTMILDEASLPISSVTGPVPHATVTLVTLTNGVWTQNGAQVGGGTQVFGTLPGLDIMFPLPLSVEKPHLANLTHLRVSNNISLLAAILDDFPLPLLAALSITDWRHSINLSSLCRSRSPLDHLTSLHLDARSIQLDGVPWHAPALEHLRVAALSSLPSTPFLLLHSLFIDTPSLLPNFISQSLTPPPELFPALRHLRLPLFPTRAVLERLPPTLESLDVPRGDSHPLAWIRSWRKVHLPALEVARFRGVDDRVGRGLADAVEDFRVKCGEKRWRDEGWWPEY